MLPAFISVLTVSACPTQGVRNPPLFACPCALGAEAAEKDMFKLSPGTSGTGSFPGAQNAHENYDGLGVNCVPHYRICSVPSAWGRINYKMHHLL